MNIKLVQKIKVDGNSCRKSARVLKDLKELNLLDKIDEIIAADQRQHLFSSSKMMKALIRFTPLTIAS